MPFKRMALKLARKLVCMEPQEQEDAVPEAIPSELEPDEAHAVEPGRPYQDYVESEARRYWQSLVGRDSLTIVKGSLTKPDQEELRAAAMPVLVWDLSNNLPVPRENSLIRGDYVYIQNGLRITKADDIKPWPYGNAIMLDRKTLLDQGWDACYTMYLSLDKKWYVLLFWAGPPRLANGIPILHRSLLENMHFSPYPPP